MDRTIITYETHHGSARKVAAELAAKLGCDYIDVDTPYEAEKLENFDNIILVFGFRGPYTAQLTKLYLSRKKDDFKGKNVFLVGEGLFSEKEFPLVAEEIHKTLPCQTFNTFFIKGELRVDTLTREEKAILAEFSRLTGVEIKDMGELDLGPVDSIAAEISRLASEAANATDDKVVTPSTTPRVEISSEEAGVTTPVASAEAAESAPAEEEIEWVCPLCGYVHKGPQPPDVCPLCGAPGSSFKRK